MVKSLIRLDGKHISVDQLQMSEDQILEMFIRNLPALPLREVGFLHVTRMDRECKLDPTFVSALLERWRPETHTFYLSCGECTITLEDVQLQLRLPVDGLIVTRSVVVTNWRNACEQLLGRVLDMIYGARIDMNWLKKKFGGLNVELSEIEREQRAWTYILMIIGGLLMPDKSRNLFHLR
ncbi:hypothetical protein J1N35_035086 [Gossypium stocksii]|uniref:Aminotransferase-like plant mobile domain-containing protein n=1 Tax=Gossypium stocksii TaxID=47602 RepID=A0A9D3ZPT9_9ROSI|nr:hypothetical protein J1N35_035086 [Gossypium stocksii]